MSPIQLSTNSATSLCFALSPPALHTTQRAGSSSSWCKRMAQRYRPHSLFIFFKYFIPRIPDSSEEIPHKTVHLPIVSVNPKSILFPSSSPLFPRYIGPSNLSFGRSCLSCFDSGADAMFLIFRDTMPKQKASAQSRISPLSYIFF